MKYLGYISLIVMVAVLAVPTVSHADGYSRTVFYWVYVYAYEGPNGEAGPYYCGNYFDGSKNVWIASHGSNEAHRKTGINSRDEWWTSCGSSSSSKPRFSFDEWKAVVQFIERHSEKKKDEVLTTTWDRLRHPSFKDFQGPSQEDSLWR